MKEIVLNTHRSTSSNFRKFVSLVDDEDFDKISKHKWYAQFSGGNWYARTWIKINNNSGYIMSMHRMIMGCGRGDKKIVDHKSGDTLNNQKFNLRLATKSQNNANKISTGKSKYLGVVLIVQKRLLSSGEMKIYDRKVWGATVTYNRKKIRLGRFNTEEEAALAYNKKAVEIHGEFARLNVIPTQPPAASEGQPPNSLPL